MTIAFIEEPRTWVDVEAAVREWTRDNVASIERKAFFGASEAAGKPQIALFRLAGPDHAALVQFDVWGTTKAEAAAVAAELATAADALARYEHEGVRLISAVVESVRWLPDPETNAPRQIVEVVFMAVASGASS